MARSGLILLRVDLGPSGPTMLLFVALLNGPSGSNLLRKFGAGDGNPLRSAKGLAPGRPFLLSPEAFPRFTRRKNGFDSLTLLTEMEREMGIEPT